MVKYATDVTQQVRLLSNLKALIDLNFGEIEKALERSGELSATATGAASGTSGNVQAVAAAAEQLAASAREISTRMTKSRETADAAQAQAEAADQSTQRLVSATRQMGGIVDLIRSIASQINLLALNATIEAARAGEAGRGFAVVATEVKNLANQAAHATDQISGEIDGIQAVSSDVVDALEGIRNAIGTVREYVLATAGAIEEQSAVAHDMSLNMQSASQAVATVTDTIGSIVASIHQVSAAVGKTKEEAQVLAR